MASSFIRKIVVDDIKEVYVFIKKLGSGSFGTVRLAHPRNNPNKLFAIKSILRDNSL